MDAHKTLRTPVSVTFDDHPMKLPLLKGMVAMIKDLDNDHIQAGFRYTMVKIKAASTNEIKVHINEDEAENLADLVILRSIELVRDDLTSYSSGGGVHRLMDRTYGINPVMSMIEASAVQMMYELFYGLLNRHAQEPRRLVYRIHQRVNERSRQLLALCGEEHVMPISNMMALPDGEQDPIYLH